jgi:hypothetical protein
MRAQYTNVLKYTIMHQIYITSNIVRFFFAEKNHKFCINSTFACAIHYLRMFIPVILYKHIDMNLIKTRRRINTTTMLCKTIFYQE